MASTLISTIGFPDITKNDATKVGSKGMNIAELTRLKIPLPPGFVITSEAYYYFLDMARIREKILDILTNLDVENSKELEEASNIIQDMIIKSTVPPVIENAVLKAYSRLSGFVNTYVAVRSSISSEDSDENSFAGLASTFLNIRGGKDVTLAMKACWASLFEPNSIYYRSAKGISHVKVGMSVVIQKMVQAEVSGTMLTMNPITSDSSTIIIEGMLGLGDIMEAEALTPDHYEIEKSSLTLIDKKVYKQTLMMIRSTKHEESEEQVKKVQVAQKWQNLQKLDDKKIVELASIGKVIEQQFGEPQDIEWVMEAGKIYILQSRSIAPSVDIHPHPLVEKLQEELVQQPIEETVHIESAPANDSANSQIILSGSPASEGVAEGYVKIVRQNDDFIHLNTGDILVIDRIIPDYILWMRKAAGIITNEGGVTSHAAVLSREFKIPCIVGTENATEILSNNDYVRIDGSSGQVFLKLIEKNLEHPSSPIKHEEEQIDQPFVHDETSVQQVAIEEPVIENIPQVHLAEETIPEPLLPVVEEEQLLPENVSDFTIPQETISEPVYIEEKPKETIHHINIRTATKILANLSDKSLAPSIAQKDADGIGYINGTEILNTVIKRHPEAYIEEEIVEKYVTETATVLETFCREFNPRPVIYRPSNLISTELQFDSGVYEPHEDNPKLGYNGAVKYIENPSLFNLEVEAIKTTRNKSGYKNLSLMLPMVRNEKDLREIKKIVTSNDLKRSSTFKIYLPIEAPSTVLLIHQLIDIGIDGLFIMANTLSGLLNAADLENPKYKNFNVFNEAFMLSAEVIIKTAHKNKIPSGVILQGKEFDSDALSEIIEWGATYISVDPYYIEKTKATVADIEKNLILSRRKK